MRNGKICAMQTLFPIILVLLAIFVAGCVAYIAWELTSDKHDVATPDGDTQDPK